jgi:DNA-binding SARP family transcriptional activator
MIGFHVCANPGDNLVVRGAADNETAFTPNLSAHHGLLCATTLDCHARLIIVSRVSGTKVQLCGRFVAQIDGHRLDTTLPGRQGRMLFAFLVLNRERPVGRAELIEALWAQNLPRKPADTLAALLSKVRSVVGEQYLPGRANVELTLPADADIDVEEAIAAIHDAESACAMADWPRAWGSALAAQIVARRTLLVEFEAEWIDEWRRELESILLRSLECYSRACLGIGGTESAGAERSARALIRLAPLRESGYGLLMAALEAEGNAAEALSIYDELRTVLRDELGTAPGAATQTIYLRLLGTN